MCKKNDYGRKAITAFLAVLTALFALAVLSGGADASPVKEKAVREIKVAAKNRRPEIIGSAGAIKDIPAR